MIRKKYISLEAIMSDGSVRYVFVEEGSFKAEDSDPGFFLQNGGYSQYDVKDPIWMEGSPEMLLDIFESLG